MSAWLFADEQLKMVWAEVRGQRSQRRLRLRIDADAPELHAIPWELLCDSTGSAPQDLATTTATPFSRYLAGQWQPGNPLLKCPIKMAVAVANPANIGDYDLTALDIDEEFGLLEDAT